MEEEQEGLSYRLEPKASSLTQVADPILQHHHHTIPLLQHLARDVLQFSLHSQIESILKAIFDTLDYISLNYVDLPQLKLIHLEEKQVNMAPEVAKIFKEKLQLHHQKARVGVKIVIEHVNNLDSLFFLISCNLHSVKLGSKLIVFNLVPLTVPLDKLQSFMKQFEEKQLILVQVWKGYLDTSIATHYYLPTQEIFSAHYFTRVLLEPRISYYVSSEVMQCLLKLPTLFTMSFEEQITIHQHCLAYQILTQSQYSCGSESNLLMPIGKSIQGIVQFLEKFHVKESWISKQSKVLRCIFSTDKWTFESVYNQEMEILTNQQAKQKFAEMLDGKIESRIWTACLDSSEPLSTKTKDSRLSLQRTISQSQQKKRQDMSFSHLLTKFCSQLNKEYSRQLSAFKHHCFSRVEDLLQLKGPNMELALVIQLESKHNEGDPVKQLWERIRDEKAEIDIREKLESIRKQQLQYSMAVSKFKGILEKTEKKRLMPTIKKRIFGTSHYR